ncbi:MAG: T9SS type A sorting domain-containing protein, partial [Bacteroidales bacterium]|nr:T9SS type A sorting domain-containing protein [Bacteroidales bacterium]
GSEYTDTLVITASSQSIQIANESQFALYPNPATNNVRIASDATIEQVEVINVAGVVVMKEYVNNNSAMLNVEKLNNGIYAVRVRTNKGTSIQRMVVSR